MAIHSPGGGSAQLPVMAETLLDVEGATCGGCVKRIESSLRALPGVAEASFNLATRRARVVHDAAASTLEAMQAAVARAGYRARAHKDADGGRKARSLALWRMGVAGLAMMQVMMFAWPAYITGDGTLDWDVERLFMLASLA